VPETPRRPDVPARETRQRAVFERLVARLAREMWDPGDETRRENGGPDAGDGSQGDDMAAAFDTSPHELDVAATMDQAGGREPAELLDSIMRERQLPSRGRKQVLMVCAFNILRVALGEEWAREWRRMLEG
jgi:hypothetical protein